MVLLTSLMYFHRIEWFKHVATASSVRYDVVYVPVCTSEEAEKLVILRAHTAYTRTGG